MNPFDYQHPAGEGTPFIGRKVIVDKIYSRIAATRPQSVSIVGPPGIGKTSLMRYLTGARNRQVYLSEADHYIYIYLELQSLRRISFKTFSARLCRSVLEQVSRLVSVQKTRADYDLFKKIVESLHRKNYRIILFFDDFHLITQNPDFPLELFSFFRSLANNYNLAFVTSSFLPLQKLCVSKDVEESPFFNIFSNITLKPFNSREAMELIQPPLAAAEFSPQWFTEKILRAAGPFPLPLQMAGYLAYEKLSTAPDATEETFNRFLEDFCRRIAPYYQRVWDYLEEEDRQIFHRLLTGRKIDHTLQYRIHGLSRNCYVRQNGTGLEISSSSLERFLEEKLNLPHDGWQFHLINARKKWRRFRDARTNRKT